MFVMFVTMFFLVRVTRVEALGGDVDRAQPSVSVPAPEPVDLQLAERTFAVVEQRELGRHGRLFAARPGRMQARERPGGPL